MSPNLLLDVEVDVDAYIESQPPKQKAQIWGKIFRLRINPRPNDAEEMRGYKPFLRVTIGQHRIIYLVIENIVKIVVVASRNDDDAYKIFERKVKNFSFAA